MLGFDHASKIALVAADALFPILLATYQGAVDGRAEAGLVGERRRRVAAPRACSRWC